MTHPPLLLYFVVLLSPTFAQAEQCYPPELDNGVVESNGGDFFLTAVFQCDDGYTLSGPSLLKCRNGIWSGVTPVCSVSGCDPNKLPTFVNGRRLKVKGTRNSVFKYKCNRGYRLLGPKNVYCTVDGWKIDQLPVCARPGCDESSLLGGGTPHGHQRSMFQGAVVRFYCESGAMMSGNSAVYCDGYSWNGTKPECLVPPTPPVLSLEVGGVETASPVAAVGQNLRLVCTAMGGNPAPDLSFLLNGEHVEGDKIGDDAVYTITVEDTHNFLDMSCIAQNRLSSIPVASNHQRLRVRFGPSSTYIHGPEMLMPGTDADYSCTSAESDPAADISVHVTDQDGNIIDVELTKLPKMKGSAGFASALQFKFPVLPHYKSVFMKCDADNGVGQAMSQHVVNSMYPPSDIDISQSGTTEDQEDILRCVTDQSNPAPTITWLVETADKTDNIPEELTTVETINEGTGWRKISTMLLLTNKNERIRVYCMATMEGLGFTKMSDVLEILPTEYPESVSVTGPSTVLESKGSVFHCLADMTYPAPSLKWTLDDSQDLTEEAEQTNNQETDRMISSHSVLNMKTSLPVGEHVIKCHVGGTDIHDTAKFVVEDLSIQLSGLTEGSEVIEESPLDLSCTVAAVPGLRSIQWWVDGKQKYAEDMTGDDKGNMVSYIRWRPDFGDTRIECRAELEGKTVSHGVSLVVVEDPDYGYGEDVWLAILDEEEQMEQEGESSQMGGKDGVSESKEESIEDLAQADEEDYTYEDENYDYVGTEVVYKKDKSRSPMISHNSNEIKEAADVQLNKKPDIVIDATKQDTTFAASEPESAVLSHKSDSTKPISADLLSPKSIYSASIRIWPSNIFVYLSAISCLWRLISY